MGDIRERRGKLPEQEIAKIFKRVSYTKFSNKRDTHYDESPPASLADTLLKEFYRTVEGDTGILLDSEVGFKKPKSESSSQ